MKFRKKPSVVDAIQFYNGDYRRVQEWAAQFGVGGDWNCDEERILIYTLKGTLWAGGNDWIIRGVNGEFYICKPDIFEAEYERV